MLLTKGISRLFNMTNRNFLNHDDVIWMEVKRSPCGTTTNTVKEISNALCSTNIGDSWIRDGVECSVLFTDENGWRKGKVKIVLEFIPEGSDSKPEQQETHPILTQNLLPPQHEPNLDDLRKELNL